MEEAEVGFQNYRLWNLAEDISWTIDFDIFAHDDPTLHEPHRNAAYYSGEYSIPFHQPQAVDVPSTNGTPTFDPDHSTSRTEDSSVSLWRDGEFTLQPNYFDDTPTLDALSNPHNSFHMMALPELHQAHGHYIDSSNVLLPTPNTNPPSSNNYLQEANDDSKAFQLDAQLTDTSSSAPTPSYASPSPMLSADSLQTQHLTTTPTSSADSEPPTKPQTATSNHTSQNQHMLLTPLTSFPCHRCARRFLSEQSLLAHNTTKHKQSSYPCTRQTCPRVNLPFNTKKDLARHVKSVHGPQISLPCGKSVANRKDSIRRHAAKCKTCSTQHTTGRLEEKVLG